MAVIADKAWWKSKTIWTSVAGVVGVAQAAGLIEAVPEVVWTCTRSIWFVRSS